MDVVGQDVLTVPSDHLLNRHSTPLLGCFFINKSMEVKKK